MTRGLKSEGRRPKAEARRKAEAQNPKPEKAASDEPLPRLGVAVASALRITDLSLSPELVTGGGQGVWYAYSVLTMQVCSIG